MKNIFKEIKSYLPTILITYFVVFAISLTFAIFFSKLGKPKVVITEIPKTEQFVYDENASPIPQKGVYSAVFLGMGGEGHSGGSLTDSIIQIYIDTINKKAAFISIPRDLWISIPTDYNNETPHKINEAYSISLDNIMYPNKKPEYKGLSGAGNLVKDTVEKVTGIPVDYYVTVDFRNFENIVDLLGGLDVNSSVSWDDYFYPVKGKENETCGFSPSKIAEIHSKYSGYQLEQQFTCRYEHIHFDKGTNHLDGELALKYVRSRHSETYGGDFARSEKQFSLLSAVAQKLISSNALKNGSKIIGEMFKMVTTDLNPKQVGSLTDVIGDGSSYDIKKIYLNNTNVLVDSRSRAGAYILLPRAGSNDFSEVKNYILQNM